MPLDNRISLQKGNNTSNDEFHFPLTPFRFPLLIGVYMQKSTSVSIPAKWISSHISSFSNKYEWFTHLGYDQHIDLQLSTVLSTLVNSSTNSSQHLISFITIVKNNQ